MKIEQAPKICDICKGHHPTYSCKEKVDIEAKAKKYREELFRGKPEEVEERRRAIFEGKKETQ